MGLGEARKIVKRAEYVRTVLCWPVRGRGDMGCGFDVSNFEGWSANALWSAGDRGDATTSSRRTWPRRGV